MIQAPNNIVHRPSTPQHDSMGVSSVSLESLSFKHIGIKLLLLNCIHVTYFHICNVESGQSSHDAWTATAATATATTTEGPYSYKLDATASSAATA